jgi:hypothetical protein
VRRGNDERRGRNWRLERVRRISPLPGSEQTCESRVRLGWNTLVRRFCFGPLDHTQDKKKRRARPARRKQHAVGASNASHMPSCMAVARQLDTLGDHAWESAGGVLRCLEFRGCSCSVLLTVLFFPNLLFKINCFCYVWNAGDLFDKWKCD